MKVITIVLQIGFLYVFYITGSLLQRLFHLPIPGSIIGLFLLFIVLLLKVFPATWIETGSAFLLDYLSLLFVPATTGVMNYFDLFAGHTIWLFIITMISTLIVMIFSGHTSRLLARYREKRREGTECQQSLSESSL
ncbi:CidA/LrgA family holin-like protein [Lentibacillus lipolyticus]|nr:CidA/LrgA family holin-like protein [Lentibacillus lipolyticus]